MICHQNKLIFIHLPKCGGTSVETALNGKSWHQRGLHKQQHLTAKETRELYGERVFQSYFKCAIVRNTWDLLVAYYLWGTCGLDGRAATSVCGKLIRRLGLAQEWGHPFAKRMRKLARHPTFAEYLQQVESLNKWLNFSRSGHDLTRQFDSISIDGKIAVDYVGRFEDLPNEFRRICEFAGVPSTELPHRLKSTRTRHYSQYYTPEMRDFVLQKYREDIEHFGFSFDQHTGGRW